LVKLIVTSTVKVSSLGSKGVPLSSQAEIFETEIPVTLPLLLSTDTVKLQVGAEQEFVAVMSTVVTPLAKVEPEPVPLPLPVVAPEKL